MPPSAPACPPCPREAPAACHHSGSLPFSLLAARALAIAISVSHSPSLFSLSPFSSSITRALPPSLSRSLSWPLALSRSRHRHLFLAVSFSLLPIAIQQLHCAHPPCISLPASHVVHIVIPSNSSGCIGESRPLLLSLVLSASRISSACSSITSRPLPVPRPPSTVAISLARASSPPSLPPSHSLSTHLSSVASLQPPFPVCLWSSPSPLAIFPSPAPASSPSLSPSVCAHSLNSPDRGLDFNDRPRGWLSRDRDDVPRVLKNPAAVIRSLKTGGLHAVIRRPLPIGGF